MDDSTARMIVQELQSISITLTQMLQDRREDPRAPTLPFDGTGPDGFTVVTQTQPSRIAAQVAAEEGKDIMGTTNALRWANYFVKLHGGDRDLMLAWFANAIEAGRHAGLKEAAAT